jgi:copper resistance protein B
MRVFAFAIELNRKFAPYIGFAYTGDYGQTATFTREEGGNPEDPRFIFGVRLWY